jgi:hypothetical protein
MARIPKDVENKVVSKLYADAAALDWAHLTPQQRSAQYTKWVQDSLVGGRLKEYLTAETARVWIKDGPMKEWSRSISGVGKYAALVEGSQDTHVKLVRKALGEDWTVLPDSLRIKPLRLVARKDEDETVVTWAAASELKHLVWAALSASAEGDTRPWVLCVVGTFTKPTPANEKQAHQRLAQRCGLRLTHVEL